MKAERGQPGVRRKSTGGCSPRLTKTLATVMTTEVTKLWNMCILRSGTTRKKTSQSFPTPAPQKTIQGAPGSLREESGRVRREQELHAALRGTSGGGGLTSPVPDASKPLFASTVSSLMAYVCRFALAIAA